MKSCSLIATCSSDKLMLPERLSSSIICTIWITVCASALQRFLFVFCFDWLFQLVSIGSQYSCGRAQQSEYLLIVSREVKGEERCFQKCCSEVCHTILFALTLICLASLRFCCFQIIPLYSWMYST